MTSRIKDVSNKLGALSMNDSKILSSQDIDGNLRLLSNLHTQYKKVPCRSCRADLSFGLTKEHIRRWIATAKGSQPAQISGVLCRKCQKWTCFGCRGKPTLSKETFLIDKLCGIVRNDSIVDMGKRADLYNAVLNFIVQIANHPILVKLLTEKRPDKKRSPGVQDLGDRANRRAFDFDNSTSGMCASLVKTGLETLKHAKAFTSLSRNETLSRDLRSGDSQEAVAICRRVIEFYKVIDKTAPEANRRNDSASKDSWAVFTEKNRVAFSDSVLDRHSFYSNFSQSRPGRMSALMKEIASLTTSLPPGIFLKISESRPDVMKALIAGVEGSVYEGGLFAFDIALPQDWPVDPPRVHFVLEGHDSHRDGFNPNLYATGELCLSLLNTFPACSPEQKWQPNRSTLSSVFVSIQAMILGTSNPHANEVGCDKETEESSAYARQYNDGARRQVVQYAILYWLRSSSAKRSIWYDIAEQYYKNKRKEVIARVKYLGGRDNEIWMAAKDVEKCLGGYSSTSYQSRHR